jgi:hypothetical protein
MTARSPAGGVGALQVLAMLLSAAPAGADSPASQLQFQHGLSLDLLVYGSAFHGSPLNPTVYASGPDTITDTLYGTYDAQAKFGTNVTAALSATGSLDETQHDGFEDDGRLMTASLSVTDDSANNKLTIGKQLIKWSQDTAFHPFDLIGRFNEPRSGIGLNQYNPYLNEGVYAVRASGHDFGLDWQVLADDARQNISYQADWQAAGKVDLTFDSNTLSVMAEQSQGYAPRFGLSISKAINDNWLIYSEYLHYRDRSMPALVLQTAAQPAGAVTLPALWAYEKDSRGSRNDFLLTLRYSFDESGIAELSYFYNGSGYGGKAWENWLGILRTAQATYTDPAFIPFYPTKFANPNGTVLGASATMMERYYFRNDYLNLHVDTLERFPQIRLQGDLLYGLDDQSVTLQVTASHDIAANITVSLFAIGQTQPANSENAVSPYSGSIGGAVRVIF